MTDDFNGFQWISRCFGLKPGKAPLWAPPGHDPKGKSDVKAIWRFPKS